MRCDARICLRPEYEAMVERFRVTYKSGGDSGPSNLPVVVLSPFFSLAELPNLLELLPASHRVFISLRADLVVAEGQSDVTVPGPLQGK